MKLPQLKEIVAALLNLAGLRTNRTKDAEDADAAHISCGCGESLCENDA